MIQKAAALIALLACCISSILFILIHTERGPNALADLVFIGAITLASAKLFHFLVLQEPVKRRDWQPLPPGKSYPVPRAEPRPVKPVRPPYDRPRSMPAWGLTLRSPFVAKMTSTSWLGGLPHAPETFEWPRGRDDQPLYFAAQIDLGDLRQWPQSNPLPATGALLIFVGSLEGQDCHVAVLDAGQMTNARETQAPEDLNALRDGHFVIPGATFHKWAIDLHPFEDMPEVAPDGMPYMPTDPQDWMLNWGLAAYEGKNAIMEVERAAQNVDRMRTFYEGLRNKDQMTERHLKFEAHINLMEQLRPSILPALKTFVALAETHAPTALIDKALLADIWALRGKITAQLGNTTERQALDAQPGRLLNIILGQYHDRDTGNWRSEVPDYLRPFLTQHITAWRGHRLFGQNFPSITNEPDVRGLDCVLSLTCDTFLGNISEHENGYSIWCAAQGMQAGDFSDCEMIAHIAV